MVITSITSPQIGSIHSDADTIDQEDVPGRPVSCISPNQAVREEEIIPEIPVVQVTEKASLQIFANANLDISANSSIKHPTTEKIVPEVEEDESSPKPKAKESKEIQPSLADVPKTSTKKDTLAKMLAKQRCCVVDLNETETLKQVIGTLLRRQKDHNDCLDFENIRQKTIRFDAKGDMKNSARAISKQAIQMDVFSDSTSFSMLKSKEIENDAVFLVMLRILGFVNLQTYPRAKSMNYLLINLILRPEPKPNLDSELAAELAFDLFIRVLHQHAPTSSIARKYYLSIFRWSHDEDYGQHFEGDLSFWKFFCDIWSDYFSTEPSGQPLLALQIILTCLQRDFEYWLKHGHGSKLVESKPMIFFLFVKDTNIEIHLLDFLHQFDTKIYSDPKVWKLYWRFIAMIALMVAVRDRDTKLTFLHRREALKYKIAHCLSLSFTKVRLEPRKEYTHLSLLRPSWLSHLVTSNLLQLRLGCSSGSTASNSSGSHDDNELPRRDFQFELLVRKKTLNYSLVSQTPEEHQRLLRANIALDKFLATFYPQTIHLSWFMQQTNRHSQNPCRWMKHKSKPMDGEVIKWDSHVHDDLSSLLEKLTIINKVHEELERKNPTQTSDDVSKLTVFSNKLLFLAKD
ncbi:hypothetical protein TCAL_11755 [Tigriopus californicus]|uniref:Uncharacterized protein n=1 Tax=Tigriopus californicus TaxID=6832 RepID=A0A553P7I8_TIGCA|nr:uncharacterized protein LOC131878478 [Tigriopus californicus]TRY73639.1 hypothetical protein TCAL_11755 [Tigriopus californicus]